MRVLLEVERGVTNEQRDGWLEESARASRSCSCPCGCGGVGVVGCPQADIAG
jgi:hypothetical protein